MVGTPRLVTVAHIRRILILTKYRFIGDTLLSVPAIRAASELWPDARITLLTGPKALELVENCPYIHDTIEFDPYRKPDEGLRRFFSIVSRVRAAHFDLALVLNRSFHSALISTLGAAKRRAGWAGFSYRDFLLNDRCAYNVNDNEVDSYLDVIAAAYRGLNGANAPLPQFDRRTAIWLTDAERSAVPDLLRASGTYIGMQPGASHSYKRWPADRFAAVADHLLSAADRRLVLVGGPDERDAAGEMMAQCSAATRARTIDLTGSLSLRGTLAALEPLSLFVGNDTAIRHAAVALDVPSIALFGPTSAVKWGNAIPPRHEVMVSPSGKVEEIPLEAVIAKTDSLLDPQRKHGAESPPGVLNR